MSSSTAAPAQRAAAAAPLAQLVHIPLLHCRHYVRNYFDLFQDLLARIYSAGGVNDNIIVLPGSTVGEALDLTEQAVAAALAAPDANGGESVLLSLLRTIMADEGVAATDVDNAITAIQLVLNNASLNNFRRKANDLEDALVQLSNAGIIAVSEAQIEKMMGAFRSIGKLIADLIAFEFPRLVDYRQDLFWNPERYLLISGPYRAVLSNDPKDVLSCSFAYDKITVEIKFKSLTIDESANFEFFKIKEKSNGKNVIKEKHEMLMSAIGSLVFRDVTVSLVLDDSLDAHTEYSWAPGHDVRRASWTIPSVEIEVESVDLDLGSNAATVLLSFLEGSWFSVQKLEEDIEASMLKSINDQGEIAGLGKITRDYVSPIAQKLIPVTHALSRVRIADPFEGVHRIEDEIDNVPRRSVAAPVVLEQWEPVSHLEFDKLKTVYDTRAVGIKNEQPDPPEIESEPIPGDDEFHWPDNLDDLDPPGGTWAWPSSSGGGFTQLDLQNLDDRAVAVGYLERAELSARTRAIAALNVEGFATRSIGALRVQDFNASAGTVYGRPVGSGTVNLLKAVQSEGKAQGASEYLFRYDGFDGSAYLVEAELRNAQRGVLRFANPGGPSGGSVPPEEHIIVPDFNTDIWKTNYAAKSPLKTSRGSASDPGWVGLSTNCVAATTLYRKLKEQYWFRKQGETRNGSENITYQLRDCEDVVADFSGDAPDDAPGLAIYQLRIEVGAGREPLTEYKVDLRLRLKPWIYGRGCIPDEGVIHVWESLECIEGMIGAELPLTTRLRQLDFRDFVFLRADFQDQLRDIQVVHLTDANGNAPANGEKVRARIRAAINKWFPTLPEPPILYNSWRPVGGESRNFVAQDGWLSLYRRYSFPDFSDLDLG